MLRRGSAWVLLLALVAAIVAACGSTHGGDNTSNPDGSGPDSTIGFGEAGFGDGQVGALTISPANSTVNVSYNQPAPVQFTAYYNGQPVSATWDIDQEQGTEYHEKAGFRSVRQSSGRM